MTKRLNAKKKISRSLGENLWGRANDSSIKRNFRPGEHGTGLKRDTTYGLQLKAKQRLKKYYGEITEKQFSNTFKKAKNKKGDTSQLFIGLLESRLDMIVYRANFVPTIFAARQFVNHKHVLVNGKSVNIASYSVKPGDVIQVRERSRSIPLVLDSLQKIEREIPTYLDLNAKDFSIKYSAIPAIEDVPYPVKMEVNLVVEYYSK